MDSRTFYTLYAPFRTAKAVERAANGDVIVFDSTGRTLYAVHPVPSSWLLSNLSLAEQKDMLKHIADSLSDQAALTPSLMQAVRTTRDHLESLGDKTVASKSLPVCAGPVSSALSAHTASKLSSGTELEQRSVKMTVESTPASPAAQQATSPPINIHLSPMFHLGQAPTSTKADATPRLVLRDPAPTTQAGNHDASSRLAAPSHDASPAMSQSRDIFATLNILLDDTDQLLSNHFPESERDSRGGKEIPAARECIAQVLKLYHGRHRTASAGVQLANFMVDAASKAVKQALSQQIVRETANVEQANKQAELLREQWVLQARRQQEALD